MVEKSALSVGTVVLYVYGGLIFLSETKGQIVSVEKTSSSESSSWWPFDWWSSSEQVHQSQQPATSYKYSQEGISQEQHSQERYVFTIRLIL